MTKICVAAGVSYSLFLPGRVFKFRPMVFLTSFGARGVSNAIIWGSQVLLSRRTKRKNRDNFLLCFWKLRIGHIATHRMHLGYLIEGTVLCRFVQGTTGSVDTRIRASCCHLALGHVGAQH
jgi:hypothetical protein